MDKKINILVSANASGVTKGFSEAAQAISKGGAEMAQSSTKATEAINASQKSLQQEYRATYKAAQILAEQQGTNSAAFREAAIAAASYKDRLEDVQDAIKAASPEQRWKLVGSAISGVTDVAQGLVGAMSLVGIESNNAAKFIQAMMSIAAVGQIVPGIIALSEAYTALSIVLSTTVMPALAAVTVEMALATAGITLIVAGIAFLAYRGIKYYNDLGKAAKQAGQEMTLQNEVYRKAFGGDKTAFKPFSMKQNEFNEGLDYGGKSGGDKKKSEFMPVASGNGSYLEQIASKGLPAIKTMKDGLLELKQIGMDSFVSLEGSVNKFGETMDAIVSQVGGQLISLAANGFQQFAEMAGAALAGDDVDFGAAASQMLGSIASTLSAGLIAMGIPLLFSGITAGQGAALIAAGGAMGVVAGALKANQKPGSSGGGGGGSMAPRNSAINYTPDAQMISVGGLVRGNNLIIATENTQRSNNRIR